MTKKFIITFIIILVFTKYIADYEWDAALWVSLVFSVFLVLFPRKN